MHRLGFAVTSQLLREACSLRRRSCRSVGVRTGRTLATGRAYWRATRLRPRALLRPTTRWRLLHAMWPVTVAATAAKCQTLTGPQRVVYRLPNSGGEYVLIPRQSYRIGFMTVGVPPDVRRIAVRPSDCSARNENGGTCSCSNSNCSEGETCHCQDTSGANPPSCECS